MHGMAPVSIVPAQADRAWISQTHQHFAKRCLPLLMANQAGWFILSSHSLRATRHGGDAKDAVSIEYAPGGDPRLPALSHFGHGILTWHMPFLFRTPPGWQLLARGPANWPKDGIHALEG